MLKHLAEPTRPCDVLLSAGAGNAAVKALVAFEGHLEVSQAVCNALRVLCFQRKDGLLEGNVTRALVACSVCNRQVAAQHEGC